MTRDKFIKKWLSNDGWEYNEATRGMMRDDLDSVIDFSSKANKPIIENYKYRKTYEELTELSNRTFLELIKMNDWHFRIIMNDENVLDIYPKKRRYCAVKEYGMVNNRWGFYQNLIPFVESFFKLQ